MHRIFSIISTHHQRHNISECLMYLPVIGAHAHDRFYFIANKFFEHGIVVAFVDSAKDQYHRLFHAFQCKPGAVYVCGLAIIYELNILNSGNRFHAMLQTLEGLQRFPDLFLSNVYCRCRKARCHAIVLIVLALDSKVLNTHLHFFILPFEVHLRVRQVCSLWQLFTHGKWG